MLPQFNNVFLVSTLGEYASWSLPKDTLGTLFAYMKAHIDQSLLNIFR